MKMLPLCLSLAFLFLFTSFPQAQSKKAKLKIVKHRDLVQAIAAHKGKVVLVDFWGLGCLPCRDKFPKVVELQDKYRAKGLVCISVNFDKSKYQAQVRKFLNDYEAFFPNYQVEDPEACQEHWQFQGLPCYLVFGKDGKLAHKFCLDPDRTYQFEDIEKAILKQEK